MVCENALYRSIPQAPSCLLSYILSLRTLGLYSNTDVNREVTRPKNALLLFRRYLLKKKPIAPFPPLCFIINAKPPDGQLYYFAYGPEMNPNRYCFTSR